MTCAVFHSMSVCAGCGVSGDDFACANVEAFEVTGELYCDDCAGGVLEALAEDDEADPSRSTIRAVPVIGSVGA